MSITGIIACSIGLLVAVLLLYALYEIAYFGQKTFEAQEKDLKKLNKKEHNER